MRIIILFFSYRVPGHLTQIYPEPIRIRRLRLLNFMLAYQYKTSHLQARLQPLNFTAPWVTCRRSENVKKKFNKPLDAKRS